MKPLVSVWMVTYNHEKYIRQSLESVVKQKTDFPFEVVIGEDCSTDNTRAVIKEFEDKYPDIVKPIYHDRNVGAYRNAYEFVYPKLQGVYVACLEGDDYWVSEDKLQMQVNAMKADPGLVMCFTKVDIWEEKLARFLPDEAAEHISKTRFNLKDVLQVNMIRTGSVLFRNDLAKNFPAQFNRFKIQDWPLFLFLLQSGDALYIDKLTTVYRKHDTGVYSPLNLQKRILINIETKELLLQYPDFQKYKHIIKYLIAKDAYVAASLETKKPIPDKSESDKLFSKAIKMIGIGNLIFPLKSLLKKLL